MYLDRMADLLLKEGLRAPDENKKVRRAVARARTLTVLRGLDCRRKGLVVEFLKESGLIDKPPIVSMEGANLIGANLPNAELAGANLRGAIMSAANEETS